MSTPPTRDDIVAAYEAGAAQLLWMRFPDDLETPVSVALKLGRDRTNMAVFESVYGGETRSRYSIIACDPDLIWRIQDGQAEVSTGKDLAAGRFVPTNDADPLAALRAVIADAAMPLPPDLPAAVAGLFGYLSYEMARYAEPVLPEPKDDPIGAPEAILFRPQMVIVFDAVRQDITLATPVRPTPRLDAEAAYEHAVARLLQLSDRLAHPAPPESKPHDNAPTVPLAVGSNVSDAGFRSRVEAAKRHIVAGEVFQIVPGQRFSTPFELPPFALYRSLRRMNPSPYMFYVNFEDFAIVGSSPEILVKLDRGRLTIRPLAGTRPRGADPAEDAALEAELLEDPKERAEHLMLLDLGRNDVGRVAQWGSVKVTDEFLVERYSHVMHIVSNVEGELRDGLDAVDALFAGFPAGTVTGAPKVRAMELIHDLEAEARGVYAGGVGYFSANGDMDTCIALRTGVLKDGFLHVRAGAGVVYDSDPEAERQESVNKASALFRAAADAGKFV